jgi:peptidoglycan glycosyltransferase
MNVALRRVGVAIVGLIVLLIAQLTYLQVIDADNLAKNPANVRAALRDANRPRGPIVTDDGEIVAISERIKDNTEFDFQRKYPLGTLFSQIVGYQSFVFGNIGVEKTYNDQLIGRDAELQLKNIEDIGSESTGTVVLSMSAAAQRTAAEALGNQRGSVVLLDVRSGGIVAMYSNPSYDPNPLTGHDTKDVQEYFRTLTNDPSKPDLPRAYRERYAPGSTFKVVTATSAIDVGIATPDTEFAQRSEFPLPQTQGVTIKNFGGDTCGGTLFNSFRRSCNTTFAQLGQDLGNDFVPAMNRFGIDDTPPLDVAPGAAASIGPLESSFDNQDPEFALAGIGQGQVAVTPLQMALVAEAIANNGEIKEPHVGKEIRDADDNLIRRIQPDGEEWKVATSPSTAQAVNAMMRAVVESGTGTAAQIPGVAVAGKTGTAQVSGNPNPHAWFVGFAPAEAPRFAVAVLVENGGDFGSEATGGEIAAPIARRMLELALNG